MRGARMADGGGDVWSPRQSREEDKGEDDKWARARKRKKSSLKFETKLFPGSKIHQILTRDR